MKIIKDRKIFLITVLILSILGLMLCCLLAKVGFNLYFDPDYKNFCSFNSSFNCDAVATSKFAVHFGLPNFLYGIAYYSVIILSGFYCLITRENRLPNFLIYVFWLSLISVIISGYLFTVSVIFIKSKCILCLMVYFINVFTFVVTFMAGNWSLRTLFNLLKEAILKCCNATKITIVFIIAIVISISTLFYFNTNQLISQKSIKVNNYEIDNHKMASERIVTGASEYPYITILEFTDFECPFCAKASTEMKKVLKKNPDVRLILKNLPLDKSCNKRLKYPFHGYACKASIYAICAAEQSKFWNYQDLLINNQSSLSENTLIKVAEDVNLEMKQFNKCIKSKHSIEYIITDIDEAVALGVKELPTFFIEGRKVVGYKNEEQFQEIINEIKEEKRKNE